MPALDPRRLITDRLELVPAGLDHLAAELESTQRLADLLRARVEPGWPPGEYDRDAQEYFQRCLRDGGPEAEGWYGWYALAPDGGEGALLVGGCGYFGPPDCAGEVEIGFSVMPGSRGLGYATEMAGALVRNAFADPRVARVRARASEDNAASIRVLEKCLFRSAGPDADGLRCFEIVRGA
ncbi:GNAT family N-acetyltransferase [Desulfocurvus sp. DL9XJH121]